MTKPTEKWLRAYGSEERVDFVKALPCVVNFRCDGPVQNAHHGTGGTGRKADADRIFPCCTKHHAEIHQQGVISFQEKYDVDLDWWCAATEKAWLFHQERNP